MPLTTRARHDRRRWSVVSTMSPSWSMASASSGTAFDPLSDVGWLAGADDQPE